MSVMERLAVALADRYSLEREVGAGGMATVYLAHDLKHDRDVAIKVLHPDLGAALGGERFLSEIRTTARLQHPHILPLLDSGDADGLLYYVMPLVTGETLRERLERDRQLSIDEATRIAREVADALGYAHGQNVIHRDIKPENILLQDGHALVADFGIALAVQSAGGQRMTQTGLSLGTPQYMSPEQAMGERAIDARSDIYALGAVTYEMLAGDPPFTGSSVQAIVAKVMTERPSSLQTVRDTVPEHVEAAVMMALAKLPADRPASAAAFGEMLTERLTTTRRRAVSHGGSRRAARLPWAVACLATALAVWGWSRARGTEPPRYRFTMQVPSGGTADYAPPLALSPDGRSVVYRAPSDRGQNSLWIRRLDRLEATVLTAGGSSPTFSPDGGSVAYVTSDADLHVMPLDGRPDRVVLAKAASFQGSIDWGDDGYIYYTAASGSDEIWRVAESGGQPTLVVSPDTVGGAESGSNAPAYTEALPGGKGVLVTFPRRSGTPSDIAAVDLRSGQVTYLLKGHAARYAMGLLFYIGVEGELFAVPFDPDRLVLTGAPIGTGYAVEFDDDKAGYYAVSEGGTLVYAAPGGGRSLLAWVDRTGVETIVDPELWRPFNSVALSPDGRMIAAGIEDGQNSAIWKYDIGLATLTRLTLDGRKVFRPIWSPDGSRIAYASDRESTDWIRGYWIQPADGSGTPELLVRGPRHTQELTWSADGRSIAYREGFSDGATMRDIWMLRAGDDTTPRPVVDTDADERSPQLSPDGRWLAYTSDRSGNDEVYVQPFPDGPGRWQVSTAGGTEPRWRGDGGELYFRAADGNLMTVPILPGATFATGPIRKLFQALGYYADETATSYDVTADGSRFLMIKRPQDRTLVVGIGDVDAIAERLAGRQ